MGKFFKSLRSNLDFFSLTTIIFTIAIISPIALVFKGIFLPSNEIFEHIKNTVLNEYLYNTLIISIGVVVISGILGVSLAWFVSVFDFPFRKFFSIILILPLAIPSYIGGYIYSDMFSYTGSITRFFTKIGINLRIDILNIYGAIIVFSLFFYPYVFIIMKSYFRKSSKNMVEVSLSLGKNLTTTFFKVILPLSRVAIISGISLVLMETLNAYGLVSYFGVNTFSIGIFRAWLSLGDITSALKLSAILVIFIFLILYIENKSRGKRKYSISTKSKPLKRIKIKGGKSFLIFSYCLLVSLISFIIPVLQLFYWMALSYLDFNYLELLEVFKNSLLITLVACTVVVIVSIIISNTMRLKKDMIFLEKIVNMGYSIPGAVIAIGVMTIFIFLDRNFKGIYNFLGIEKSLFLSSSYFILIFAYLVRFLAVSYSSIDSTFKKIGLSYHQVSRTFGFGIMKTFFKVDLPMIKPAIFSSFILVFIEIIKELPLTLILRPFNFNTLSTLAQQYANDEMLQESSIPSLMIIFLCSIAVLIFTRKEK